MRHLQILAAATIATSLACGVMAQQTDIVTRDVIVKVPVKVEADISAINMGIEVQCWLDYDENDPGSLDLKRAGRVQMAQMDAMQVALQPGTLFTPTQADGTIELEFVFPVQYYVNSFGPNEPGLPGNTRMDLPNPWPVNATCRARPADKRHGPRFETYPEVAAGSCDLSMARLYFDDTQEQITTSGCIKR